MKEYLVLLFGFAVLIALKFFLVNRTYEQKKNLYSSPYDLARDIMSKKDKNFRKAREEMYDINTLVGMVAKRLAIVIDECKRHNSFLTFQGRVPKLDYRKILLISVKTSENLLFSSMLSRCNTKKLIRSRFWQTR
jgi:hypothetical protein